MHFVRGIWGNFMKFYENGISLVNFVENGDLLNEI